MRLIFLILIFSCLAIQYPLWIGDNGYQKLTQLKEELKNEEEKRQSLIARNNAMKAEIEDLQSGVQALEERARSELGMISSDEFLVQFTDESNLNHNNPNKNFKFSLSPDQEKHADSSHIKKLP
ncbi:cell division protein FtsB [Basilea psittacipulmonis]|uniref:Cell division protein FtsB n=1 Tax=Basilea psittacipulmonis DSM 24701 TaxID=1072685 RepID=A0A077DE51_9BURK|nr:cell division protein FtsB [Basilea psittacipulmonis]AIL33125.1 hypothetical protein IX83_07285 [Basilea psittacipulmonis DSM 24701]